MISKSLVFIPVHLGCILSPTKVLSPGKPSQEPAERNSGNIGGFSLLVVNVVGMDIPT